MLDREVVLLGYSGHAYVVADAALSAGINLKYYAEKAEQVKDPFYLKYIGDENDNNFKGWNSRIDFILGVGDNGIRMKIAKFVNSKGGNLINVIHPKANISKKVSIGNGVFVGSGACINPLVDIQKYSIINTGSIVEHECTVGMGSHIAPGALLAGNVKVGNNTFIGANSVIKEGVTIGDNVIIGAGSVIINDVESNKKVVGNPSREL